MMQDLTIDRVLIITVDSLRWDYHEKYRDLYPTGIWYRGTPQATSTPMSLASMLTGVNPPRSGVHEFGDSLYLDTILDLSDSGMSASMATSELSSNGQSFLPISDPSFDLREVSLLSPDAIGDHTIGELPLSEYDISLLHDWIVHASNEKQDGPKLSESNTVESNTKIYEEYVDTSIRAHKQLLRLLKEQNLYENTLFVIWGDHGQGFGEPPLKEIGHNHKPSENVARVPIAFSHPQMDESIVDTETNARSVDILPTVTSVAGDELPFDEPDQELEGVDLTSFDGELAGYTICLHTAMSGIYDGVRSSTGVYIKGEKDLYARSDINICTMEECEPDFNHQKLVQIRDEVRNRATKAILKEQPDEQMMKDLGYL